MPASQGAKAAAERIAAWFEKRPEFSTPEEMCELLTEANLVARVYLTSQSEVPKAVRVGIEQAKRGELVDGPDLEADAELFDETTFEPDLPDEIVLGGKEYVARSLLVSESVNAKLLAACEWFMARAGKFKNEHDEHMIHFNAIAAARAQAEDDAKPVDEEWLKLIGFSDEYTMRMFEDITSKPQLCFRKFSISNECWIQARNTTTRAITNIEIPRPKTRGDVRRLLAALGVKSENGANSIKN